MSKISDYAKAVKAIKTAILQSRYCAARMANAEQLKLYFNIGCYVSANTRNGKWGTGAIDEISRQLQAELPGLRGFSPVNIKYMRLFFETWQSELGANRQLSIDDLKDEAAAVINRQLTTADLSDVTAFLGIGFTHHIQIFSSCKTSEER